MPRPGPAIHRQSSGQITTRSANYLAAALALRSFPMPPYFPGLHILATFTAPPLSLCDAEACPLPQHGTAQMPLLALPQSTHYVLDGFIWRRRK